MWALMMVSGIAASSPPPQAGEGHGGSGPGPEPDEAPSPTLPRERGRERAVHLGALCALLIISATVPARAAGDVAAGRQKALQCQTCHGLDGLSKNPEAPNLAGQVETYLAKALDDYRKGARQNEMMSVVAPSLSDQDIADLAAYFSAIEIEAKPPPR
jgi:cytochrome c553